MSLAMLAFGLAPAVLVLVPLAVLAGTGNGMVNVCVATLVMTRTQERMRGRVSAALGAVLNAASVGSLAAGGALAAVLEPRQVYLLAGGLVIAVLGGWLLREGFPRRLLAGLAVSFAGAVVVGVSESGGGGGSLLGVGMCLLAAVSYATAVVGQKPALRHASALQVTTFGCFAGTVASLPFAGQLVPQAANAPAGATLMVVYLGVVPTALAFTTWAYALNRTTAGNMGATTYIVPALVVLMSWAFLGETPRPLAYLGGALCLAGVAISRDRAYQAHAEPAPELTAPDAADREPAAREAAPEEPVTG